MVFKLKNLVKYIKYKHECVEFIENVYGDRINFLSTSKHITRSLWRCKQCGRLLRNEYLVKNKEDNEMALRSKFY
jgi:hypothetical protein